MSIKQSVKLMPLSWSITRLMMWRGVVCRWAADISQAILIRCPSIWPESFLSRYRTALHSYNIRLKAFHEGSEIWYACRGHTQGENELVQYRGKWYIDHVVWGHVSTAKVNELTRDSSRHPSLLSAELSPLKLSYGLVCHNHKELTRVAKKKPIEDSSSSSGISEVCRRSWHTKQLWKLRFQCWALLHKTTKPPIPVSIIRAGKGRISEDIIPGLCIVPYQDIAMVSVDCIGTEKWWSKLKPRIRRSNEARGLIDDEADLVWDSGWKERATT